MKNFKKRFSEIMNSPEYSELKERARYEKKVRLYTFLLLAPATWLVALTVERFMIEDSRTPSWCAVALSFIMSFAWAAYKTNKKFNHKEEIE